MKRKSLLPSMAVALFCPALTGQVGVERPGSMSFNYLLDSMAASSGSLEWLSSAQADTGFRVSWDFADGSAEVAGLGTTSVASHGDLQLNFIPWTAPAHLHLASTMETGFLGHASGQPVELSLGLNLPGGAGAATEALFSWSGIGGWGAQSLSLIPAGASTPGIAFVLGNLNSGVSYPHSHGGAFQFFRAVDSSGFTDMEYILMRVDADGSGSFDDGVFLMSQAPLNTVPEPGTAVLFGAMAAAVAVIWRRRRAAQ